MHFIGLENPKKWSMYTYVYREIYIPYIHVSMFYSPNKIFTLIFEHYKGIFLNMLHCIEIFFVPNYIIFKAVLWKMNENLTSFLM